MRLLFFVLIVFCNPALSITPQYSQTINKAASPTRLKAGIQVNASKGDLIRVLPDDVINSENLIEGDNFSALVSKDSVDKLDLPEGSRLSGYISKVVRPRFFRRKAFLEIVVDKIIFPDGQSMSVDAEFVAKASGKKSNTGRNWVTSFSNRAVRGFEELTASTMVGAIDSIQYAGIGTAILTHGISVGAGAGLGLGVGLIGSIKNKGEILSYSGFEAMTLKLKSDFEFKGKVPLIAEKLKPFNSELIGINIKVNKIKKFFSAQHGNCLLLDIDLENNGNRKLYLSDLVLVSNNHPAPILSNPFISDDIRDFAVDIRKNSSFKLAFNLGGKISKRDSYELQLIDPVSENILADFKINLAEYL